MNRLFCLAFLICHWASGSAGFAAIIDGFDPARHERFLANGTANPDFFLDEAQLSGVAIRGAVLITPRHFISATHINADEATFRGIDGIERTYQSQSAHRLVTPREDGSQVGSDIHLHTLEMEVDPNVLPVPVVVGDLNALIGRVLIAFDQHSRAGRNVIDDLGIAQFTGNTSDTVTAVFSYDTATNGGVGGLGTDEIGLLGGDSGSTALVEIDGRLGVIGAHMGIDVPEGSSAGSGDRYDSFSSLIGAYEGQLRSLVEADGYSFEPLVVSAIPEPGSPLCLIMLTAIAGIRRRRR